MANRKQLRRKTVVGARLFRVTQLKSETDWYVTARDKKDALSSCQWLFPGEKLFVIHKASLIVTKNAVDEIVEDMRKKIGES